ncbi:arabinofuranosidase catalytic domain-containing protein [Actinacidiphila rubida]|uniref:Ricin-type beta-trefoil lectin domain-containing protein n=1 Tax=Actinacidiphila rubida TaxID=310780 RepID=A0A1H8JL84_9ACTN|nr:arabinofuranosidase catalytic domain-containing protein [Actinacidiphila rubida]SEN81429.1 Ricin-type beta-trefoil lectin domain-containing protein [Actinacidiphila rubida]
MTGSPPRAALRALLRRWRRTLLGLGGALALTLGLLAGAGGTAHAAGTLPCDIYGGSGTPCVGAFSTVRALYSSYDGNLYRVVRVRDGATLDVGVLSPGGYAAASAQNAFCTGAVCVITTIYDQSPQHNDLTIAGAGTAGAADVGAMANVLHVTVAGHAVYGVYVPPGVGYRHARAAGVATNGQPEGMYMVASGTHTIRDCCFDFGNVEAAENDTGAGHMDALNISPITACNPCHGTGPWVQADLENGIFQADTNAHSVNGGNSSAFVTALLKNNGQTAFALKGGDARSGGLATWWNGALPPGYAPMRQEGSIVMGTGGDNSNRSGGSFFEGAITSGYPSDAADDSVQADIVSAGYAGDTAAVAPATISAPGGSCVDVTGDDVSGDRAAVQLWGCQSYAADQHWLHEADGSLSTLGRCLDIDGNGTANNTQVELWDCNGVGGQKWVQRSDGSLLNPQSGRCLDATDGATADGTRLQIHDCNGTAAQKFAVNGGGMVAGPAAKCLDISADDVGGNGAAAQLWDCQSYALDQHWVHTSTNRLTTLGRCLDIAGNSTAQNALVQLWDCGSAGGQVWVQQSDGSLLNPQSGRCLDATDGATANGTRLQIHDCNGTAAQEFALS